MSFASWTNEIAECSINGKSQLLLLFNRRGEILQGNSQIKKIIKTDLDTAFANPTLIQILSMPENAGLIFKGFVTINNGKEFNVSLYAHIYRHQNDYLLIGGIDFQETESNLRMYYELNREITSLQRVLLKERLELQRTHDELLKANQELETANLTKNKFMSIIAHDLRSPFHALIGLSEVLSDTGAKFKKDEYHKFGRLMSKSINGIYNLLENLLLWANLQRGDIPFEPANVSVQDAVSSVIDQIQISLEQKDLELNQNLENGLITFCDEHMLKTVLRNLLSNAVKFSNRRSSITISSSSTESTAILSVTDQGIGISEEDLQRMFRLDIKLSRKGTEGESSSGLGLLLCKEFIEKNSGTISVSSQIGKGTTFTITLPRAD